MWQTGWRPAIGPPAWPATGRGRRHCLGGCGCAQSHSSSTPMMSGYPLSGMGRCLLFWQKHGRRGMGAVNMHRLSVKLRPAGLQTSSGSSSGASAP